MIPIYLCDDEAAVRREIRKELEKKQKIRDNKRQEASHVPEPGISFGCSGTCWIEKYAGERGTIWENLHHWISKNT